MTPLEKLNIAMSTKVQDSVFKTFRLAILAGIYVGTGALLYAIMTSISGDSDLIRLAGALLFTIGLNLVVFLKAQLFTGNNLMIASLMSKKISLKSLLRNWFIVYVGNFVGAICIGLLIYYIFKDNATFSKRFVDIAILKTNYEYITTFYKAILCNFLVCSAIFFAIVLNSIPKKVIGIVVPISMFVFLGFEHSIANMFFIPLGFANLALDFSTAITIFMGYILPVTIGNILGGYIFSIILIITSSLKS